MKIRLDAVYGKLDENEKFIELPRYESFREWGVTHLKIQLFRIERDVVYIDDSDTALSTKYENKEQLFESHPISNEIHDNRYRFYAFGVNFVYDAYRQLAYFDVDTLDI